MRLRPAILGCLVLAIGCGRSGGPASPGRPGEMRLPRLGHTMTRLADGSVLVAGGLQDARSLLPPADTDVELYDPATGRFTVVATMETVRAMHTATLLGDGRVLVIGGTWSPQTEIIDVARATVAWGPRLNFAREDHRTTRLADGRLLVTGGSDPRGKSLDVAEIYDQKLNRFTVLPARMNRAREDHTADLLPDGRVLITGGEDNQAGPDKRDIVLDDVEIFDPSGSTSGQAPATGSFTKLPPLSVPRDDHRSGMLPGGAILITGGEDANDVGTRTAEIIVPPPR